MSREQVPMSEIKATHAEKWRFANWFAKGAMQFFGTKLPGYGWRTESAAGSFVVFICQHQPPYGPPTYAAHVMNEATGEINMATDMLCTDKGATRRAAKMIVDNPSFAAVAHGAKPIMQMIGRTPGNAPLPLLAPVIGSSADAELIRDPGGNIWVRTGGDAYDRNFLDKFVALTNPELVAA